MSEASGNEDMFDSILLADERSVFWKLPVYRDTEPTLA